MGCDHRRADAERRARRRVPPTRPQSGGANPRVPRAVPPGRAGARRRRLAAARPGRDGLAFRHPLHGYRYRHRAGAERRGGREPPRAADRRGRGGRPAGGAGHPAAGGRLVRAGVFPDDGRLVHLLRIRRRRRRREEGSGVPRAVRGRDRRRVPRRHQEDQHDAGGRAVRGARRPAPRRDRDPRRWLRRGAARRIDRAGAVSRPALDVARRRSRRRQHLGRLGGGRRPRAHGLDLRLLRAAARVARARRPQRPHHQHRQQQLPQRPRRPAAARPGGHRRLRLRPAPGGPRLGGDAAARRPAHRRARADARPHVLLGRAAGRGAALERERHRPARTDELRVAGRDVHLLRDPVPLRSRARRVRAGPGPVRRRRPSSSSPPPTSAP